MALSVSTSILFLFVLVHPEGVAARLSGRIVLVRPVRLRVLFVLSVQVRLRKTLHRALAHPRPPVPLAAPCAARDPPLALVRALLVRLRLLALVLLRLVRLLALVRPVLACLLSAGLRWVCLRRVCLRCSVQDLQV